MDNTPPRLVALDGAQLDSVKIGDVGQTINKTGADPDKVVDFAAKAAEKEAQFRLMYITGLEKLSDRVDALANDIRSELRNIKWVVIIGLIVIVIETALR